MRMQVFFSFFFFCSVGYGLLLCVSAEEGVNTLMPSPFSRSCLYNLSYVFLITKM